MARDRKKIAVWKYDRNNITLDVPVYMVQLDRRSRRPEVPAVQFAVDLTDPDVHVRNVDINELQKAAFAEIDAKLSIEWRPVLLVRINGQADPLTSDGGEVQGECESRVLIEIKRLRIAEVRGKKIRQLCGGQRQANDEKERKQVGPLVDIWCPSTDGWPETGEDRNTWGDRGSMRALIPDTPENRAALDQIVSGFDKLLDRLKDLLSPDKAQKTLANIGKLKLLA